MSDEKRRKEYEQWRAMMAQQMTGRALTYFQLNQMGDPSRHQDSLLQNMGAMRRLAGGDAIRAEEEGRGTRSATPRMVPRG